MTTLLHLSIMAMEVTGIAVIVLGAAVSLIRFVLSSLRGGEEKPYRVLRASLGRSILLGLEFLVAADIVNTVAIEPSLASVGVLAGIVLIRTFLSFALEMEIEGRFPWQSRHETKK